MKEWLPRRWRPRRRKRNLKPKPRSLWIVSVRCSSVVISEFLFQRAWWCGSDAFYTFLIHDEALRTTELKRFDTNARLAQAVLVSLQKNWRQRQRKCSLTKRRRHTKILGMMRNTSFMGLHQIGSKTRASFAPPDIWLQLGARWGNDQIQVKCWPWGDGCKM